jgi:hypothetical protein
MLHTWIAQAQVCLGSAGPRLGWLVAATVITAALQRAADVSGTPLFLLKGGTMLLNGVTWRRVQIDISPDEGDAGTTPERFSSPSLAGFGLPTPDHLVGLSMRYEIARKFMPPRTRTTHLSLSTTALMTWWTFCCCERSPR